MVKKLSLGKKLSLSAGAAIVAGGLLVAALSTSSSLERMDSNIENTLSSSTESYNKYVHDWLDAKGNALKSFPSEINKRYVVTHLKQVKDSADFDNVFLAYADGGQDNANGVVLPKGNDDPRKWGWYTNAMSDKRNVFVDNPTVAAATGANVVSLGKHTTLRGEDVVLGADVEITDIIDGLKTVNVPGEGYMFIADTSGKIFTHPNTDLLNKSVSELGLDTDMIERSETSSHSIVVDLKGEPHLVYAKGIRGTRLITVSVINESKLLAPLMDDLQSQAIIALIVVVLCSLLFNTLCGVLFRPLASVSDALEEIAKGGGDLTRRIDVVNKDDEVGKVATSFNLFVESLQSLIGDIRVQSGRIKEQSTTSAGRVQKNASDIEQQQAEIAQIATAVTELASATNEIASHAEKTAASAQESSDSTTSGKAKVEETKESVNKLASELDSASGVISELNEHVQDISTVLMTIQGVAEQTNLLALNAAIEAARAGEQGRGFAVVADEVRVLSQRTQSSTEEIKNTIQKLQSVAGHAVEIMASSSNLAASTVSDAAQATDALNEIHKNVSVISDMATHIATAAEQQAQVTEEVTQNITSVKDVADALVVDAADGLQQAESLEEEADFLSEKVGSFSLDE